MTDESGGYNDSGSQLDSPSTGPGSSSSKRKTSTNMPGLLKRAVSSPNVKGVGLGDSVPASPADKKKNKLGYHRTAVACGHCRRRKIRCVASFDDPDRCQNCIRLKKDCHFFPVDQQLPPATTKRARPPVRTDGTVNETETSVSSSSPSLVPTASVEPTEGGDMSVLPSDSPGSFSFPASSGAVMHHGFVPSTEFDYSHSYDQNPFLASPYLDQSPHGFSQQSVDQIHGPFHTPQYAMTPSTVNMTPNMEQGAFAVHSPNHSDYGWPEHHLVRSMSSVQPHHMPDHNAYHSASFPHIERRSTLPAYPHQIEMSHFSSDTPPFSPELHQHMYRQYPHDPQQRGWQQMANGQTQHTLVMGDVYGQNWYGGSQSLTDLHEEEDPAHPGMVQATNSHHFQHKPG